MKASSSDRPGAVIVVDVIRAFTTACHLIAMGAASLTCAATLESARAAASRQQGTLLVGEDITGVPSDFSAGNSPYAVGALDVRGRPIVLVTSKGTRALVAQPPGVELFAGAVVNLSATIEAVRGYSASVVEFVATGSTLEDDAYIYAARRAMGGESVDADALKRAVVRGAEQRILELQDMSERQVREFRTDAEMCGRLDAFRFALRGKRQGDYVILRPEGG